jgi:hypothetical protein
MMLSKEQAQRVIYYKSYLVHLVIDINERYNIKRQYQT